MDADRRWRERPLVGQKVPSGVVNISVQTGVYILFTGYGRGLHHHGSGEVVEVCSWYGMAPTCEGHSGPNHKIHKYNSLNTKN